MFGIADQLAGVGAGWKKKPDIPLARRHVNKGERTSQVSDYMLKVGVEKTTAEIARALGISQDKASHALRRGAKIGEVKKLREQRHGGTVIGVWITTRSK